MFTLNDTQRVLLATLRAWREEGERRFDHWSRRQTLQAATEAFAQVLERSGLRTGRTLASEDRIQLLRLAAELAPNRTLSRRLYASDPADFDRRLRRLLHEEAPLETRLRAFLAVRGSGALTAAQLLCSVDPQVYPLITRAALRQLRLSAAQKRAALAEAAEHYGFEPPVVPDAAQSLLALFRVYDAVRTALGSLSYPEVDDLLKADVAPLAFLPPTGILEGADASDQVVRETRPEYQSVPALTETALLAALEEYVLGQGFTFPEYAVRSYYVALKTKPFAILSGVSGTGKTRLAELFAEFLTGHAATQFRLIPVRPDWADSAPLFGYHNALTNRYVSTPFLDILRAAGRPENRLRAFFVCLDEMNLARVEHYLADYLSALESRTHRVPLHEDVPDLVLPPNVFVTGTVNVDETTHAFSRKVLDRANTLDFDFAPRLQHVVGIKGAGWTAEENHWEPSARQTLFLGARLAGVGRARERLSRLNPQFSDRALTALQEINDRLYLYRQHFAYRVRDEVLIFLAGSFDVQTGRGLLLPDPDENFGLAFDLQVCQKILPKLNGLPEQLDSLMTGLQKWAEEWPLPRTVAKLARMKAHGAATGYVRFYE